MNLFVFKTLYHTLYLLSPPQKNNSYFTKKHAHFSIFANPQQVPHSINDRNITLVSITHNCRNTPLRTELLQICTNRNADNLVPHTTDSPRRNNKKEHSTKPGMAFAIFTITNSINHDARQKSNV